MEYYILKEYVSNNNFCIIAGREPNYNWQALNSQGKLSYFEFPKHNVIFSKIILENKSKLYDFIYSSGSYGGSGYLVSEKVKNIFSNYKMIEHKFYLLPLLEFNGQKYQYYWMQILVNTHEYSLIDFSKSNFIKSDFFNENSEHISFESSDTFINYLEKMDILEEKIFPNKICIKNSNIKYDLFYIDQLYFPFIVSEKLKNNLELENVSGIRFEKTGIFF